ncbi:hypothetical protein B0I35DRAFT_431078 [Stachybotrys elegans]|uniref:FAD-binding PCMH-type domain-containing protein n=1 Tax=Stachybotrys elegans TaxID=80388 RepID=A0A8K0SS14_9HYPO|nr:hypothetical protein B0I35DRAFT_431078 [Stachybotrys elegans]
MGFQIPVLWVLANLSALVWASLLPEQMAHDLQSLISPDSDIEVVGSNQTWPSGFTPRWAITAPPKYIMVIKPRLVTDVQAIIRYASTNDVPFLATGGGHGYSSTLGGLEEGISIDMGYFDEITVNTASNTMTTGGAVKTADIVDALHAVGREIPVGQCICIGYSGATLGGGIGPYSGLHGTQSDSLLSVQMVNGRGDIVTVSKNQNRDLFYGIKGAGANFGVVTSLTYRVYPATNGGMAMNADMMFPGALNGSVWELARSFAGNQPKELSITFSISYNATIGDIVLIANFIYAGPQARGRRLIKPFLDLGPINLSITTVTWSDLPRVAVYGLPYAGCRGGSLYVPQSLNLYRIDVANIASVVNYMKRRMAAEPSLQSLFVAWAQYSQYGFAKFSDDSSAFPHRDAVAFVQIDGFAMDPSQVSSVNEFGKEIRDRFQRGSGRRDLSVYVNFAHGDEPAKAWYSSRKLPKLRELKRRYDPNSSFSFYNPIL